MIRLPVLAVAAASLSACATMPPEPVASVAAAPDRLPPPAPAQSPHDALFALFAADDEATLELNPMTGIYRGDLRHADRLGDMLSPEYDARMKAQADRSLAALHAIDRAALSPTDRIAYDVFEYQVGETLKDLTPEMLALTEVRPINHFTGFHTAYPTFSDGKGAAPYKTVLDYDNGLSRNRDYVAYIDRAIGKFREGLATGVVDTSLTIGNVIQQLDNQLALPLEQSPYWGPVASMPADFSATDKARLTDAYRRSIGEITAANRRLRDFLKTEYLPHARTTIGLSQMKGGAALYQQQIEESTTLPLTADELHTLGLKEVARIRDGMDAVRREVGFKGTLAQFFDSMRTSDKFTPRSRAALGEDFQRVARQVRAQIPAYFDTVPRTPLEIRPYPEYREQFEAGASYEGGSADGARPGVFWYNAWDLPARRTWEESTLFLHEGEPGHHFQVSLAQENTALPAFLRFGGNTAYAEGWALYAETLGYPMGLYKDPYQRFGTLNDEQLRAMRLVVDTGLHAKGWTRQQAIDYMLANSGETRTDATAEVERYIAIPGQALAYKVGSMTIERLRDKAKAALGERFDIRRFHDQVLDTGALPLPVLERKIDEWIAAGGP